MSKKEKSKIVWNAHIQELNVDGHEMVEAFEMMEIALSKARKPNIVDRLIGNHQPNEPELIKVRTSDLDLIVSAFGRYVDAAEQKTMGQAFGLEGDKSGVHRVVSKLRRRRRNTDIALNIQNWIESGFSREQSILNASEQFGMSEDAIRKAMAPPDKNWLRDAIRKQKEKGR